MKIMSNQKRKIIILLISGSMLLLLFLAGVLLVKLFVDRDNGTARNQPEPSTQNISVGDQPGDNNDSTAGLPQGLTAGVWGLLQALTRKQAQTHWISVCWG
jgi:hypothetical protein